MKKLVVVGAGKFAREMLWMVEECNAVKPEWEILGCVDDTPEKQGTSLYGYPILGPISTLYTWPEKMFVTIPMGNGLARRTLVQTLRQNPNVCFAVIRARQSTLGKNIFLGEGSIFCAHSLATVDVSIGAHCVINVGCTLSHDVVLKDYVTLSPGVHICGNSVLEEGCFVGAGATIIEQRHIGPNVVIGAGAVVVQDLLKPGTYVGVPARKVRETDE